MSAAASVRDEREGLGRVVREAWVAFVRKHPRWKCAACYGSGMVPMADVSVSCGECGGNGTVPRPAAHTAPWEDLSEDDREAARCIGDAVRAQADAEWLAALRRANRMHDCDAPGCSRAATHYAVAPGCIRCAKHAPQGTPALDHILPLAALVDRALRGAR